MLRTVRPSRASCAASAICSKRSIRSEPTSGSRRATSSASTWTSGNKLTARAPPQRAYPIETEEQHEAGQHGELEGDPERRAEDIAEHRAKAVPGRSGGPDVERVGHKPSGEERSRERD